MKAVDALERSDALARLAGKVHPAVDRALGSPRSLRTILSGTPLGHPAHPALVIVPMSGWLSATVLDLFGGPSARRSAQLLRGLGLAAAAPTVLTGASDWLDTEQAEQRVGVAHAMANVAAFSLFATSSLLHRRGRHLSGTIVSCIGTGALTAGGFLGGHLVYRRGVGIDTTVFEGGPAEWTAIDVDGEAMADGLSSADAGGVSLLVARTDGEVHVLENRCTHRGAPLSDGTLERGCVVCPWHGSMFDLRDGHVVRGPAVAPQASYDVRTVAGGGLEVRREEQGSLRVNPVRASP
jgi:nitrite reductase/ring-hydroxylating ferredoxin subunit/uncharacterized membrane protein